MEITMRWDGADGYQATTPSGAKLGMGAGGAEAASPMETLLASLGGCMAIDVVMILEKMRAKPEFLRAKISGTRGDDHPRRFESVRLEFAAGGGAVVEERLRRAVELSFERYCSVLHSLSSDIEFDWSATVES